MIDTIRIRFPLNPIREAFYNQISTKYMQYSPSGKIISEYRRFKSIPEEELTTQFRHKFINLNRNFIVIEFSLHKMINKITKGIRLNHNNLPLTIDLSFFLAFLKSLNEFPVEYVNPETGEITIESINLTLKEIELMKIDMGYNFKVDTNIKYKTNLFEFLHLHLGRNSSLTTEKYRGGLFHKSEYKALKFYSKFEDVKHQLKKLNIIDEEDLEDKKTLKNILPELNNIYRFEISYKKKYLKSKNIGIFNVNDIYKLKKDFEAEMSKILKFTSIKRDYKERLPYKERILINLVQEQGYSNGKELFINEFSRPTFYRIQKKLKDKGINLKNISPEIFYKYNLNDVDEQPFYIEFKAL